MELGQATQPARGPARNGLRSERETTRRGGVSRSSSAAAVRCVSPHGAPLSPRLSSPTGALRGEWDWAHPHVPMASPPGPFLGWTYSGDLEQRVTFRCLADSGHPVFLTLRFQQILGSGLTEYTLSRCTFSSRLGFSSALCGLPRPLWIRRGERPGRVSTSPTGGSLPTRSSQKHSGSASLTASLPRWSSQTRVEG